MAVANQADLTIVTHGFLPNSNMVNAPQGFAAWDDIARDLPNLIPCGIWAAVDQLSLLSTETLQREDELRWAYVRLSFISQAYIRGGKTPNAVRTHLPPQLAVPLMQISKRLGLPPVITYAATCLWNFDTENGDATRPEDLQTLVTFTGSESEAWFYHVSIAIEARGATVISTLLDALEAAGKCDYQPLPPALRKFRCCIDDITQLLYRVNEKCDPMVFFHRIRPFLAGSKNVAELPKGVFYDQGGKKGGWKQLRGGSNGQSTLIQLFDRVLGVDHGTDDARIMTFHDEMKQYMPAVHRRFLERVERQGTLRRVVVSLPAFHEAFREIRGSYDEAVLAMHRLRSVHLSIVARYVIRPSSKSGFSGAATGTGGTDLHSFLRQARDNTKAAKS